MIINRVGRMRPTEATALWQQVNARDPEFGQALRFILSSGARIDEVLHLRADKVSLPEKKVELLGKGGKTRNIRVLDSAVLTELDLSRPFVYLPEQQARYWKDRSGAIRAASLRCSWTFGDAGCMAFARRRPASLWTSNARWASPRPRPGAS